MDVNSSSPLLMLRHLPGNKIPAFLQRVSVCADQLTNQGWYFIFKDLPKGLTPQQVKQAKNWQQGIYDPEFRKELGLGETVKIKYQPYFGLTRW